MRWGICLILLAGTATMAAELVPFQKDGRLGVRFREIKYPEKFSKDLTSGLSNKILVQIKVSSSVRNTRQSLAEITTKYDLWDESYASTLSRPSLPNQTFKHKSLKEVQTFLGDLRLSDIGLIHEIGNQPVRIRVDLLVNPVTKEAMEKIQQWMAQNTANTATKSSGLSSAMPILTSRSTALVNQIFTQYLEGSDVAAVWHQSASVGPVLLNEVPVEK